MKILFIGDVVAKGGRKVLRLLLPSVIDQEGVDLVVANVENVSKGMGVSRESLADVRGAGVQVMTSGNHIWKRPGTVELLRTEPFLLRPANYPAGAAGKGVCVWQSELGTKVGVLSLLGRVFMEPLDCPFKVAGEHVKALAQEGVRLILVDFHAEATSEKVAMGWFLDGKVSAVIGTHTHVQTADDRVLPEGTGYITDVGMTGARDSVIGVQIDASLKRFVTGVPQRLEPSSRHLMLNGIVLDVCEDTGRTREVRRVQKCLDKKPAY